MKNPSRTCSGRDLLFWLQGVPHRQSCRSGRNAFMFICLSVLKQILHPDKGFGRHGKSKPIAINQIADGCELV